MSLISFENNFILVKVPKTGGTSVKVALEKNFKLARAEGMEKSEKLPEWLSVPKKYNWSIEKKWPYDPTHIPLKKIQNLNLFKFFKFTFVRNPWDYAVTTFYNRKYQTIKRWPKVKDYSFENFIRTYSPNKFQFGGFDSQYQFTERSDFIGKYENLEKDIAFVCKRIGIKNLKLDHYRKTKIKKEKLWNLYNKESIDYIGKIFAKDIKRFDYDFPAKQKKWWFL